MRKLKWSVLLALGLFILVLCLFLAREPMLRSIGSFLIVQDELKKADVIVVLGGTKDRVDEAARLYTQGWAEYIIMSGGARGKDNVAEGMRKHAVSLGVPRDKIILEPKAMSTYQHPGFVKPIMQAHGFQSAIVVSSPYHMRRSAMLFDRAFKKNGIALIYYPVQESSFQVEGWWEQKLFRKIVGREYMKMAVNVWGNGFSDLVWNLLKRKE